MRCGCCCCCCCWARVRVIVSRRPVKGDGRIAHKEDNPTQRCSPPRSLALFLALSLSSLSSDLAFLLLASLEGGQVERAPSFASFLLLPSRRSFLSGFLPRPCPARPSSFSCKQRRDTRDIRRSGLQATRNKSGSGSDSGFGPDLTRAPRSSSSSVWLLSSPLPVRLSAAPGRLVARSPVACSPRARKK